MRDYRKLRAFKLADSLSLAVYQKTTSFPREEIFALTSQLRRGVVSAASNIVEGSARAKQGDYLRFLDIANSSACEVEYQLSIARRLGYISDDEGNKLEAQARETSKVLIGLMRSIKAS